MNSSALNYKEEAIVDAVLTIFQSMSQKMQNALWAKLNSAMDSNRAKHKASAKEASDFLDTLVVKGGDPVPPEEDGLRALCEQKYSL